MGHNDNRRALGFLSVQETDQLSDSGVRVLDPCSTLVSERARIGAGTVIYPSVVVQCDADSPLTLGADNLLLPGTLLLAANGGCLEVADDCEFGPGVVQVKANMPQSEIRIGNGVRLLNGCELTGRSTLGNGCQIIGPVMAQSVRLGGGLGGYRWPNPDERGALLKGCGLARGIVLERGEVASCQDSFADVAALRQACFHPGGMAPSAGDLA